MSSLEKKITNANPNGKDKEENNLFGFLKPDSKYYGKQVAVEHFGSDKVIAYGDDISQVYKKAKEMGCQNPIIFYYPNPGQSFIFLKTDKMPKKLQGRYAAFSNSLDGQLITYGKNQIDVIRRAKKKGIFQPYVIYVRPQDLSDF